jgi:hypothetical protein
LLGTKERLAKALELAKLDEQYSADKRLCAQDFAKTLFQDKIAHLKVHLGVLPDDLQEQVINDEHPRKLCVWGRQRGKTTTALFWLLNRALKNPNTINWYVAPSYKQAKRIAWDKAKNVYPRKLLTRKPNETDLCFELYNGSKIYLIGADDPDSLRGPSLTSVVMDEYGTMRESAWTQAVQPTLAATSGHAMFIGTPNALRGPHLKVLWEKAHNDERDRVHWACWHSRTSEATHIDPNAIAEAKRALRDWEFKQEYEAGFEDVSGRVWPEFNDAFVDDPTCPGGSLFRVADGAEQARLPTGWDCVCGVDFGATDASPTAFLWLGVGPSQQIKVLAEYKIARKRAAEHAVDVHRISAMYGGAECIRFVGDPSGTQMMLEYAAQNIIIEAADNSSEAGIERVGRLLKHGYLHIAYTCKETRQEMAGYQYDPKSIVPKVIKVNDHLCDALRYACMAVNPPVSLLMRDPVQDAPDGPGWEEDSVFSVDWDSYNKGLE